MASELLEEDASAADPPAEEPVVKQERPLPAESSTGSLKRLRREPEAKDEPEGALNGQLKKEQPYPTRALKDGYDAFCQAGVEEVEDLEPSEEPQCQSAGKRQKTAWLSLSDEERAVFETQASEDQRRFERELEAWRMQPRPSEEPKEEEEEADGAGQEEGSKKRKAKPSRKRPEGYPEEPLADGFDVFRRLRPSEVVEDSASAAASKPKRAAKAAALKELQQAWVALSPEERADFESKAVEDQNRFAQQLEDWRTQDLAKRKKAKKSKAPRPELEQPPMEEQVVKCSSPKKAKRPSDFPAEPQSGYAIFCKTRAKDLKAPEPSEAPEETEESGAKKGKKGVSILKQLREAWNALSEEERKGFEAQAAEDLQRFQKELEDWRAIHPEEEEPPSKAAKGLAKKGKDSQEGSRAKPKPMQRPEGYPQEPLKTGYGLFCKEYCKETSATPAEAAEEVSESAEPKKKVNRLVQLREAWSALTGQEKAAYDVKVAEDKERFRRELEEWTAQHPDKGLQEMMAQASRQTGMGQKKPCKPRPPSVSELTRLKLMAKAEGQSLMDEVLHGAMLLGLEESRKAKAAAAKGAKTAEAAALESGGGFLHLTDGEVGSSAPSSSGKKRKAQAGGPLPSPHGAPVAYEPESSVDDLLGDLMMVEEQQKHGDAQASADGFFEEEEEDAASVDGGALVPFQEAASSWDLPEAVGAPRSLGPQLCLDEAGNIVINKSSLLVDDVPVEDGRPVQEAVSEYAEAYRRRPAQKWTDQETEMFYQALALYGTDLLLVQTFFRNKSPAQIKVKFNRELKRNPAYVNEVLTSKRRKLSKDTFEELHGKIDTSKHYKPPPSPQPGDEPEPDGGLGEDNPPEADFGDMPAPEPEYSAEDESLTTNRLMALFD